MHSATHPGDCTSCPARIHPGDRIQRMEDGWSHVECPPLARHGVCPVCTLARSASGACGCE